MEEKMSWSERLLKTDLPFVALGARFLRPEDEDVWHVLEANREDEIVQFPVKSRLRLLHLVMGLNSLGGTMTIHIPSPDEDADFPIWTDLFEFVLSQQRIRAYSTLQEIPLSCPTCRN